MGTHYEPFECIFAVSLQGNLPEYYAQSKPKVGRAGQGSANVEIPFRLRDDRWIAAGIITVHLCPSAVTLLPWLNNAYKSKIDRENDDNNSINNKHRNNNDNDNDYNNNDHINIHTHSNDYNKNNVTN